MKLHNTKASCDIDMYVTLRLLSCKQTAVLRRHEADEFVVIGSDGLWGEIPVEVRALFTCSTGSS